MSSSGNEIAVNSTQMAPENNESKKQSNGSMDEANNDLGSAASSANSSGDEEEEEEEDEDEDPEIQFKTRRTTRSSACKAKKALEASSKKKRNLKRKTVAQKNTNGGAPKKRGRKPLCKLCAESVNDLNRHLSLVHFKAKLVKLLPSQPPYKCPKCSNVFEANHDDLLSHYGGLHRLNERYLEEELNKKQNGSAMMTTKRRSTRASRRSSSIEEIIIEDTDKEEVVDLDLEDDEMSIECKLCKTNVKESQLKDHAFQTHFKDEILAPLPRSSPFSCPKCGKNLDTFEKLSKHFLAAHDPVEAFIPRLSLIENGSDNEDDEEDVTRPPKAWFMDKPKNYNEYCQQIKTCLVLNDGRKAEPVDDRSIKCVCGKIIRVNFRFNWRFLIQKPTLRDGVAKPKGHWFMCSEVSKIGSIVEDWKFSKSEIEASKNIFNKGCDVISSSPTSCSSPKRVSRKRGLLSLEDIPEDELMKEDNDMSDDEDDYEDFGMEDETPREQRLIIRKRVNELLATRIPGEIFLQDAPCFQISHEGAMMCHECKYMPIAQKRAILSMESSDSEISCCFYSFRKLKMVKSGNSLTSAGFLDPLKDPHKGQMDIWRDSLSTPEFVDEAKAKFILGLIGDQFCDMVIAEQKCLSMHNEAAENKTIVWKPAVKGVREMCDVCKTTLFNHHWTCGRCGLFVCLDCYQFRKGGLIKEQDQLDTDSDRDEYNWPLCTNNESHQIRKLLLAQIIPQNELVELANKVHRLRNQLGLNQLCHPRQEDFAEAYSLQRITDNKARAQNSPNVSGRPSLMYACRLCPETAFKWQSCLYKHCVITHFNEEIRNMLPSDVEPPYKCPKCEYTSKQKHILMLHFGITHKVVVQFIEEAGKANNGESLIIKTTKETPKSVTPAVLTIEKPDGKKAFDCPLCPLSISHGLRRSHLAKHFYAQLSAEVASQLEAPFECHLCRHVAVSRNNLIKHVGVVHQLVDQYIKDYLPSTESTLKLKVEEPELASESTPPPRVEESNVECRLCERPQFFRHNGELYKHLSVAHFSQRIWQENITAKDVRPFKCCNCDYTNGSSLQLIIHVGVAHRMAIKYHFEVLNIKDKDWSQVDVFGSSSRKSAPSSATSSSSNTSANTPVKRPQQQPQNKLEKCPVCGEDQAFPALLFHLAQHHFSPLLAASRVPVEAPFKCPLCPHFEENYAGMLRHFLIFHKQLEAMTEHVKNVAAPAEGETAPVASAENNDNKAFVPPKAEETKPLIIRQDFNQKGPFHCLLCDDLPTIGQTSYDFHKHLCEHHFRERLLAAIPQVEVKPVAPVEADKNTESVPNPQVQPQRKYGCPVANCGYELPQKWVMAKHYGLKHQVAKQLYAQICDLSKLPAEELQLQLEHTAKLNEATSASTEVPAASEDDDLDDTFDDESFDENEALNRIQEQQQQQQQQQQPQQQQPSQPQQYFAQPLPPPPPLPVPVQQPQLPQQPPMVPQIHPVPTYHPHQMDPSSVIGGTIPNQQQPLPMPPQQPPPSSPYLDQQQQQQQSQQSNESMTKHYDCKICAVKSKGMSEYLKHLSKVHFKHKLLSMVPKSSPYKCPWAGCEVTKKDRYNISLHYGMTHKVALRLMQEMPEDALNEDVEAVCKLCHQSFTAHRYLYTHLSDSHFKEALDADLPAASPWKCPKCPYEGNDIRALRVHYGVRHKVVLNHLATRLGINANSLKKEMKAGRKKAVSALKTTLHCKFCPMQFKSPPDHAKHLALHLRHVLAHQLPQNEPWKCPKCEFVGVNFQAVLLHYGVDHPEVIKSILSGDVSNLNIDMSFLPSMLPQQPLPLNKITNNHENNSNNQDNKILEDKRFPKCRLCNYRYFTRLDLCRHFVDFHLRNRLTQCLNINTTQCPACSLTYEKKQSRLRHFIWSHQDLEGLVVQAAQVRLSEFTPSLRDLEIVKIKNEMRLRPNEPIAFDFKDITDLAALPVQDFIDIKLQNPHCELCGEEFKTSVNKARDKGVHLMGHFREEIMKDLPPQRPFKCPKCTYMGRDSLDLAKHYGLSHKIVFMAMQRELGEDHWSLNLNLESENNECKICKQVFPNNRSLLDHYCSQHFFSQIAEGLPQLPPFKCPNCNFTCKTQLALVRHLGSKHKMVKKLLMEQGLEKPDNGHPQHPQRRFSTSSSVSQDSNQYQEQFYMPAPPPQPQPPPPQQPQDQWVEHYYQHPPVAASPAQYPPQPQQQQQNFQSPNHPGFASPHHQMQSPSEPTYNNQKSNNEKVSTRSDQCPVACPICNSTFLNGTHFLRHAADKHFMERLKQDLPQFAPFKCPYCNFTGKDLKLLVRHYGLNHKMVLKLLNERAGIADSYDDAILKQYETQESNRDCCPLCKSSFGGRYMLLRHLADCHFRERLCQGLPQGAEVYKCPQCQHESKDKGGFVRHYGLVHKMVQTWLKEMGIQGFDDADQAKKQQQPAQNNTQPQFQQPTMQPQATSLQPPPPPPMAQAQASPMPQQYNYGYQQPQQPPAQAQQPNQYYSSPPGSYPDQYSPRTLQPPVPQVPQQPVPPPQQQAPQQQRPASAYSNHLMSPSSQNSPQNLNNEANYISPQGTPQQAQQYNQYYNQEPSQQQALDYSNGTYFSQPYVQQPLTPQTPNPSVTPQPMTPQPMTPGSHGAPTPQPMTPQDQNSNSSAGLMSPGGYNNYYYNPPPQQFAQPAPTPPPPAAPPTPSASRPVTLQQHEPSAARPLKAQSSYVPAGDEYIEAPSEGMKGPFAILCLYCQGVSKNKSDFYRHLSERHFKAELAKELPSAAPYKCPVQGCQYETKDNSVAPLIKHYGIVHKSVQKFLRGQIVGKYVHNEAKAKQQQQQQQPVQMETKQQPQPPLSQPPQQPLVNGSNGSHEETTMSNLALKVKCPFCDHMFAARYTFHQHLCDRHFKEALAERVPAQPPYLCPVQGCGYVAKDSRQSLVRHYGMTHKVIVELLKQHCPDYVDDHAFQDHSQQVQAPVQHQQPQQYYHHQPAPPPPPPPPPAQQEYHHQQHPEYHYPDQQYQYHHPPPPADLHFQPQIDGTFDPSHYSDQSSLDGFKSLPSTPVKQEVQPPPSTTNESTPQAQTKSNPRSGPKICEICGKQFEGKNRAMLKVQHMAQHFKDKLFADLVDKTPPFKCPVEGCQYQTKHKPDWARHYGSVHQLIAKYLKEYLETHEAKTDIVPPPEAEDNTLENDEEKMYSAYLPKAELSQIINTAIDQQNQPQKNFGVITISTPMGDQVPSNEQEEHLEPHQCFICPNGPWFKNEKELNDHLSTQHVEFVNEFKPRLEVLDDLGEVLNDLDIDQTITNPTNLTTTNNVKTQPVNANLSTNRSTGRPCELCGFEPKTKNKSRERQDHLAMKHYRDRIQADLTASTNFSCPLCDYVGKDKQTIYRHYTGKHKVVEGYLAEDIAAGRVETLAQKRAKEAVADAMAAAASAATSIVPPQLAPPPPPPVVPTTEMKTLPSFEATTLELQNSSNTVAGVDLSLHGLLDGHEAAETIVSSNGSAYSERIMQVDGMTCSTNAILQVDGAFDDEDIESLTASESDDDHILSIDSSSRILQVDGAEDDDDIPQIDGEDECMMPEDEILQDQPANPPQHPMQQEPQATSEAALNNGGSINRVPQIDSRCPICDFPTKLHKTYHLATQHFKERLIATLPTEKPFKCPECNEYEAKTRINLWTHYLGKHQYSKKWTSEMISQRNDKEPRSEEEQTNNEVKMEIKEEKNDDGETVAPAASVIVPLPTPTLAIEEIIKNEMVKPEEVKTEIPEAPNVIKRETLTTTPIMTKAKANEGSKSRDSKQVEFWCDLCQRMVKFVAKSTHYATVHFEAKLKAILPTSEPFLCVLCPYSGKDFNKLTYHFLNRHDNLEEWIQQELDVMEDEAISKANNNFFFKANEDDVEEITTTEDKDITSETSENNDLKTLIQNLYYDDKEEPPHKRRKISKSIRDRGLEAVKDIIEASDANTIKSQKYKQSVRTSRDPIPVRIMTTKMTSSLYPEVPHEWVCNGKLLMLTDPNHEHNIDLFQDQWIRGQPVIVANVSKQLNMDLWRPSAFSEEFGTVKTTVVNTKTGKLVPDVLLKTFWDGFENLSLRLTDENGLPMLLKLKDWPPDHDLAHTLPTRFEDLMKCIPLKEYTKREGRYNLASFMPDFFARPDLGPKMYIAYGNALYPHKGTTNLHIDMSDACNLMVYVGIPNDGTRQDHIREGLKSVEEADCDPVLQCRVREVDPVIGAIWHIYHPRDADKIRDLLNKVAIEKGQKLEPNTDPIHDQNVYLDSQLRQRLYEQYGVVGYAYPQCEGDVVFIPAGAPHQVRNVHNCIKIAEDFVSPENLEWCFYQTEEFRHLSDTHTNHEDKLQIKNILYHSVKECVNLLSRKKKT